MYDIISCNLEGLTYATNTGFRLGLLPLPALWIMTGIFVWVMRHDGVHMRKGINASMGAREMDPRHVGVLRIVSPRLLWQLRSIPPPVAIDNKYHTAATFCETKLKINNGGKLSLPSNNDRKNRLWITRPRVYPIYGHSFSYSKITVLWKFHKFTIL